MPTVIPRLDSLEVESLVLISEVSEFVVAPFKYFRVEVTFVEFEIVRLRALRKGIFKVGGFALDVDIVVRYFFGLIVDLPLDNFAKLFQVIVILTHLLDGVLFLGVLERLLISILSLIEKLSLFLFELVEHFNFVFLL